MQVYYDYQKTGKNKSSSRIRAYFILLGMGLFFVLITYAVVYSPLFQIREFNISGTDRLSNESTIKLLRPLILTTRVKNFLGIDNLLVWNNDDMDLSKTALLELNIDRDWLNQSVNIKLKYREQFAIWCSTGDCFWIDETGTAFEIAPQTEGSLILIVHDDSEKSIILGDKIMNEEYITHAIDILSGTSEMRFPIKKINFNRKLQELSFENYSGPDFVFSTRFNPELNLAALKSLKEKVGLDGIENIDLRVENRLYYKN
ncbi:hypothetical protein GW950_01730 [Candidatus Wolfebacteria bacterium]|nr:hypothetical protein [Candidatus Wolfebacteria bacterium]